MGRSELFATEQKKREEQKNTQSFTPPDYEDIDYAALETGKVKVFRFVGRPFTVREEATDPKQVLTSRIIDDKGKLFTCRWSEDRNWLLWKIYNDVLKYTWDKNALNPATGKAGIKVNTNAIKFPNLFQRVRYNGKDKPNAMERGWNPTTSVMMNCICRDDYEWHKTNKSFKLIAKKANEVEDASGNKTTFYEPGIGPTVYDSIVKAVVEEKGDWEDFDIAIKKLEDDPWYSIYSIFDQRKISDELTCDMNGDPLTEEERSWKMFDIDKLTQVTSYRKIKNRLGDFIKQVDGDLKTNYFEQLEKLAIAEQEAWDAKNAEEQNEVNKDLDKAPETPKEEKPTAKVPVRSRASAGNTSVWDKMRQAGWKAVDRLQSELGDQVKDVTFGATDADTFIKIEVDGEVVDKSSMLPCTDCETPGPDFINFCPKCGAEFK